MVTLADYTVASASNKENRPNNKDFGSLKCCECHILFSNEYLLYEHLYNHIKQPRVILERYQLPPLKITINRTGKNFEILKSPPIDDNNIATNTNLAAEDNTENTTVITDSNANSELGKNRDNTLFDESTIDYYQEEQRSEETEENKENDNVDQEEQQKEDEYEHQEQSEQNQQDGEDDEEEEEEEEQQHQQQIDDVAEDETTIHADDGSTHLINNESNRSPTGSDGTTRKIPDDIEDVESSDYCDIQGIESPPQPESEYPKIRIKTTGLLKESISITEINDDNPTVESENNAETTNSEKDLWNHPAEDPLKLPGTDDSNLISLFNNNARAKDLGFTTSDSEFIPLDRLEERNRSAMQLYNPPPSSTNPNTLNSLTGLPMEALAQQVSRLQPSGNGMHQQNVLINIQQFPQVPPPHPPSYQPPPPMYHHPHPSQPPPPPPPMYHQPYQYQSPNPMYYPPAPGYPPHMPPPRPPPPSQMPQALMNQSAPPHPSISVSQHQNQQYHRSLVQRQQMSARQVPPPPPSSNHRMPVAARPTNSNPKPNSLNPRQASTSTALSARPRMPPNVRPRGIVTGTAIRSVRPKMAGLQQNVPNQRNQQQPNKRNSSEQTSSSVQMKRKKFDVLTPDKDDDDCQVICMQPNNKDGGLPQIQSVQGGTVEPQESNVMHLSDSITLSVRNPQPCTQGPKKSDAKAVANILATRGITVTATQKAKEKSDSRNSPTLPNALNLNGAVSIIPSGNKNSKSPNSTDSQLPTVDLTDDNPPTSLPPPPPPPPAPKPPNNNQQQQKQNAKANSLPFKCDLCPAQYPNCIGLTKHRQNYHKANNNSNGEIGIPLINLKQPGVFQKLASLGIYNYIPLPSSGPDGTFAFPIIHSRSGNPSGLGATTMLTLGPIRYIPKPTQNGVQNKQSQK